MFSPTILFRARMLVYRQASGEGVNIDVKEER